ncbi:MAG TPA: hypothetical protein VLO07_07070 [Thermoanaerobaculia bacterium]|nr:hypothetical protein [Thermoanaerobaculia bacterium]
MKRVGIPDFEFRTRQTVNLVLLLLAASVLPAEPLPSPTPTPRPRLSGGFGRARATPVVVNAPTTGQTLHDVVQAAEEAKQPREQKAGVAITNKTLVTDPNKGRLTTAAPRAPQPTPRPSQLALPTPNATGPGEAEWRARAHAARKRVEDAKERIRQLEAETKKLETDFYAWDDGQYRDGVIKPAWDKKREELETARRDLEDAERELADLPENARKAGALPGWIRE